MCVAWTGLLLVYARLVDLARGTRALAGYFLPLSTGYGVGLLLTFAALYLHVGGDQVRLSSRTGHLWEP